MCLVLASSGLGPWQISIIRNRSRIVREVEGQRLLEHMELFVWSTRQGSVVIRECRVLLCMASLSSLCLEGATGDTNFRWEKQEYYTYQLRDDGIIR